MKKMIRIISLLFLPAILFIVLIAGVSEEEDTTTDFKQITEQEQVAYQVYQFVLKNGGTKEFASAWIGNMEHESGLIPSRIQSDLPFKEITAYNPALGDMQWD